MSSIDVAKLVGSEASVSDKIRQLANAGYARADIARLLGKRYQHVRNVLEADRAKVGGSPRPRVAPTASMGRSRVRIEVGPDGTAVIPAEALAALGLGSGGVLIGRIEDGELRLVDARISMLRARDMIRKTLPPDVDLVADLLADRRREAAAEDSGA